MTFVEAAHEVAKKHGLGSTLVTGHAAKYWQEAHELAVAAIRLDEHEKGVTFATNLFQEENQRLKDELKDAINMWDKFDIYGDYQQEIKEARKLIEP